MGGRLRPARPRRAAGGSGVQPPRQPHRRRRGQGGRRDRGQRALRHHGDPTAPVQHPLPAGRGPGQCGAGGGRDPAAAAGPARLLADRCHRCGADQRLDHSALRRQPPHLGARPLPSDGRPVGDPAPPAGSRRAARPAPARRGARPGRRQRRAGRRGRIARHRIGRGRGPGGGPPLRVHLLGHVVAGRSRARRAGAVRRGAARGLHQRGRGRWHRPVPQERHRPVGALGVAPLVVRTALPGRRPPVAHRGRGRVRSAAIGRGHQ